ncbi:MAG: NACHT domain-containing protein [Mycobacterium sp.]|uniref:NACHT domain-containing protein n=1 Tax=Mycobacterium sp. TaxID=1785 RepID=UPI003F9D7E93
MEPAGTQVNVSDRGGVSATNIDTVIQAPRTPYEIMGRATYLERSTATAIERTRARRRGAGLSDEQLSRSLSLRSPVPGELSGDEFPPGSFRVLTGPLGAGKSDVAEEWFGELVSQASADAAARVPVWLKMKELDGPLEAALAGEIGHEVLSTSGCDVVVDGLDERTEDAATMLSQASDFVGRWPQCRVLLTSREMPVEMLKSAFDTRLQIRVDDLPKSQAEQIITTVAGSDVGDLGAQLEQAITRPLFAVLVGRHAGALHGATSISELIDLVVADVVEAEGYELYSELRTLAVQSVRTGRAVDPTSFTTADTAAKIRRSPLVSSDGRHCSFALATFEQWFAAKALLEGEVLPAEILTSLQSFDRWKYVLAIVLAAGEPSHADEIIAAVARWNPGAASWIVMETQRGGLTRPRPNLSREDWEHVGNRIRLATHAWLDGVGPVVAQAFFPFRQRGCTQFDETTVAVSVDGPSQVSIAWMPSHAGRLEPLPRVVQQSRVKDVKPRVLRHGPVSGGINWVWNRTLEELANDISGEFLNIFLHTGQQLPGVAQEEKRDLDAAWQAHRAAAADPTGQQSWKIENPRYPYPDIDPTPGNPWGSFNVDTMAQRVKVVVGAAMTCYLELSNAVLPNFGITLARRGLMPVEFFGVMHYSASQPRSPYEFFGPREPTVSYLLKPLHRGSGHDDPPTANRVSLTINDDRHKQIMDDKDALYAEFRSYLESKPEYAPFAGAFTITIGKIDVLSTTPATRLAIAWLWDDLKRLRFVEGMLPNWN